MILMLMGWAGAIMCLGAYFNLARTSNAFLYHLSNVIGSILLLPVNIEKGSWPSVFINGAYGTIGVVGLIYVKRRAIRANANG